MGYTTDFEGRIKVSPPLNELEIEYINTFNESRRMDRENGPYFVGGTGQHGQGHDADIRDYNRPPEGQPGLWCNWCATEDGEYIEWDFGEKFYNATEWMQYIIDHFLGQDPAARTNNRHFDFLQGHVLNGEIFAQGEEPDDKWKLVVRDNVVKEVMATITYDE